MRRREACGREASATLRAPGLTERDMRSFVTRDGVLVLGRRESVKTQLSMSSAPVSIPKEPAHTTAGLTNEPSQQRSGADLAQIGGQFARRLSVPAQRSTGTERRTCLERKDQPQGHDRANDSERRLEHQPADVGARGEPANLLLKAVEFIEDLGEGVAREISLPKGETLGLEVSHAPECLVRFA